MRGVFERGPDAGLTPVYQTLWRCRSEPRSDGAANGCGGVYHLADRRCAAKYGALWDEYRARVRWRIVPGIY